MALELLLVDDDAVDRRAVRRHLKTSGLVVSLHEASDAESALALVKEIAFDCILMDYRLPDALGTSLLEHLASSSPGDALPVVMLSGQSDAQVAAEAILLGAQDYLTKDRITPEALRRSIVNAVEKMALTVRLKQQQEDLERANNELESKVAERTAELTEVNASLRTEIAERRRAQDALVSSEQFLKGTLDALTSHIAILDQNGTIAAVNEAWRASEALSETEDARIGANYLQMNNEPCSDLGAKSTSEAARGIEDVVSQRLSQFYTEYSHQSSEEERWFAVRATSFKSKQELWTVVAHEDITSRRTAEHLAREHQSRLAHVSRISTMGEMASSLAHELNQPLTALDQYCELARMIAAEDMEPNEELADALNQAQNQTQRAGNIVRRLRDFASTGKLEKTLFDINSIVEASIQFTEHEARDKRVMVSFVRSPEAVLIHADRIQIEQVLVNLLRNSIDAIELAGSGRRSVRVGVVLGESRTARVCVADSGPGIGEIPPDALFDPFRTSKSEGMGLGLSISRSILEAHGGRLWLEPSSGAGATFCFSLPLGQVDIG